MSIDTRHKSCAKDQEVSAMSSEHSESRGCVTCLLCNATISVRIGNYGKLKLHMETNHDVFYEQDLLMALNFLEDHEREVIIEKVLPRMDLCLNKAKVLDKKDGLNIKLDIEKRLFSDDNKESDRVEEENDSDVNGEQESLEKDRIDFEDIIEDENPEKKMRLDESSQIEESLEISLDESDDILIDGGGRKNEKPPQMLGKDEVECGLCHKLFKKRSMYNHKRRCELREKIRKMAEENKKAKTDVESADNHESFIINESLFSDSIEDTDEETFEQEHENQSDRKLYKCEPCDTTYSSSSNLARHRRQRHC